MPSPLPKISSGLRPTCQSEPFSPNFPLLQAEAEEAPRRGDRPGAPGGRRPAAGPPARRLRRGRRLRGALPPEPRPAAAALRLRAAGVQEGRRLRRRTALRRDRQVGWGSRAAILEDADALWRISKCQSCKSWLLSTF